MIVESAVCADGRRTKHLIEGVRDASREQDGFAWVLLEAPAKEEFGPVAKEFSLWPMAAEDAVATHQRPKVEHYGENLFLVLKPAAYRDEEETVEFWEIRVFLGADFIVAIRDTAAPDDARRWMEDDSGAFQSSPVTFLHEIINRVVDDYTPVIEGLENDVDEIETDVFDGNATAQRIYKLSREVIQFQRATQPLADALERLLEGGESRLAPETRRRLRRVHDRLLRIVEQADELRQLLQNILNVNLTLVGVEQNARMQRQNDQVQKISAWAAILIIPTIITGVYGMNFRHMPELSWALGYPFALVLMAGLSGLLYLWFRRSGWL